MRSRFNFHCLLRIWREGKKKLQQVFKSNSYSGQRQPATIFSFIRATINHRLSFRLGLPLLLKCKIEVKIVFLLTPSIYQYFWPNIRCPKRKLKIVNSLSKFLLWVLPIVALRLGQNKRMIESYAAAAENRKLGQQFSGGWVTLLAD